MIRIRTLVCLTVFGIASIPAFAQELVYCATYHRTCENDPCTSLGEELVSPPVLVPRSDCPGYMSGVPAINNVYQRAGIGDDAKYALHDGMGGGRAWIRRAVGTHLTVETLQRENKAFRDSVASRMRDVEAQVTEIQCQILDAVQNLDQRILEDGSVAEMRASLGLLRLYVASLREELVQSGFEIPELSPAPTPVDQAEPLPRAARLPERCLPEGETEPSSESSPDE